MRRMQAGRMTTRSTDTRTNTGRSFSTKELISWSTSRPKSQLPTGGSEHGLRHHPGSVFPRPVGTLFEPAAQSSSNPHTTTDLDMEGGSTDKKDPAEGAATSEHAPRAKVPATSMRVSSDKMFFVEETGVVRKLEGTEWDLDLDNDFKDLHTVRNLKIDDEEIRTLTEQADALWCTDRSSMGPTTSHGFVKFEGGSEFDRSSLDRTRRSITGFPPDMGAEDLEFTAPRSITAKLFQRVRPASSPAFRRSSTSARDRLSQTGRSYTNQAQDGVEQSPKSMPRGISLGARGLSQASRDTEQGPPSFSFPRSGTGEGTDSPVTRSHTSGKSMVGRRQHSMNALSGKRAPRYREVVAFRVTKVDVPNIVFTEYKPDNWSLELFALYNNVIRRDMVDLFKILQQMEIYAHVMGAEEFIQFFEWWGGFATLTREVFDVWDAVVYPWLESVFPLEGALNKESRSSMQMLILQVMLKIDMLQDDMVVEKKTDAFLRLVNLCEKLCVALMRYMSTLETEIPEKLSMFYTLEGKEEIDLRMRDHAWRRKYASTFFGAVHRWVQNLATYETWLALNARGARKILLSRWIRQYEKTHVRNAKRLMEFHI
ncbi:hypothetical protein FVE85_0196 [Porphyridium purpureum]|uniref:Uncharacterized protein n=1 Tax=Porphyridium purpureum TaxID=35688 RepID=A0A5J4Z1A9_PORPP|nr:hypothetical protein FVE85_0196 [Porphyridium purpureum]|eukprot:POR4878..scf208_2